MIDKQKEKLIAVSSNKQILYAWFGINQNISNYTGILE